MKTVCITGAFGFIGRHIARLYSEQGWYVNGIGHGSWDRSEWKQWGLNEWHFASITLDSLLTYAGRPDVIIHCAGSGSVGFSIKQPYLDFKRTVSTTASVLEFMRLHSPDSCLVYPSSAGVYGMVQQMPITETTSLHPFSPYGFHKKIAEDLCLSYSSNFKTHISIVRLFSVYGKNLRKQLLWDACCKLKMNAVEFYGNGREIRDWLHIDDACTLLATAANHASADCPIINGGSGTGVPVAEIVQTIFRCYECSQEPVFTGTLRPGDPINYVADISKATSLNWEPKIEWQQGTKEYVQWFKDDAF